MINISPIAHAWVPVDARAADRVAAPNYDEFQSDLDVIRFLESKPDCILKVTMPHCDLPEPEARMLVEGSEEALSRAGQNFKALTASPLVRAVKDVLAVYAITDPTRPSQRQMGLCGLADTRQIRMDDQPDGAIIRNEGIYPHKMLGRAALTRAIGAFVESVNLAVDDADGRLIARLEATAQARPCDYEETDHKGNRHQVWLVEDAEDLQAFVELLAAEPHAYVADGNHRSAAAHNLGCPGFLAVIFTVPRMRIDPYHRLVHSLGMSWSAFVEALEPWFEVEPRPGVRAFAPKAVHTLGAYHHGVWHRLTVREGTYDATDAVQSIDADILQRRVFLPVLGITDPTDKRLTFVGGDKGTAWLEEQVDAGRHELGLAMAPVTMQQLIDVCLQARTMPPKSTWFEPKIQSGLVMAMLEPTAR